MASDVTSLFYPAIYGINMAEEPVMLSERTLGHYVQLTGNMRIENNRWRTGYLNRELAAVEGDDHSAWRSKHTQAAIWYQPRAGQGSHYIGVGVNRIVESAAGVLFAITPKGNTFTVEDVSGGNVVYPNLRLAWLCQGENYVVRTDGASPTMIWDGKNPVFFSTGYNRTAKTGSRFPNKAGPTVYAGGRFWTVLFGRRLYASDSLHQLDQVQATDLIKFTDQTYDYINVYFAPPADEGDISGLCVTMNSGFNDSRAQGEVLAFCQASAAWGVQLGVPRTQWPTTNMRRSRSREAGATGPAAFHVRDGDILMRTNRGIESLNLLARERNTLGNPVVDLGADLQQLLSQDDEESLLFASMVNPARRNRMFCTVAPQIAHAHHYHLGWVANNWNPLNQRIPQGFAWEGLNTLPYEMGRVIQFIEAKDGAATRLYALTDKAESTDKGLVEITEEEGPDLLADGTAIPKQWFMLTKKLSPGGIFKTAALTNFWLNIFDARSDITVEVSVRTDQALDWKTVRKVTLSVNKDENDPFCCSKSGERTISLGKLTSESAKPKWTQILLRGTGVATIDLGVSYDNPASAVETPDKEVVVVDSDSACNFDPFTQAIPCL